MRMIEQPIIPLHAEEPTPTEILMQLYGNKFPGEKPEITNKIMLSELKSQAEASLVIAKREMIAERTRRQLEGLRKRRKE